MPQRFSVPVFDTIEKDLDLSYKSDDLRLTVDFDDVNHYVVEELTRLVVKHLNKIPKKEWDAAVKRGNKTMETFEDK